MSPPLGVRLRHDAGRRSSAENDDQRSDVVTTEEQMAGLTAQERMIARLALVFGAAALMLGAIGLYGVLSYSVGRRASEIAVRMMVGARSRTIVAMVLRETVWLVTAGLLLGNALAYIASRLIASRLYGVAPHDPISLVLGTGVLLLVALVASYLPARRASRVDPIAALQQG
jgi:ABC-type antimicrobial peptide transport system permease subunit